MEFSKRLVIHYWFPVLAFAIVIFILSTQGFGSGHTSRVVIPVLHWLFPSASMHTLRLAHEAVRKSGHLFEYGILSVLLFRAWRADRSGWQLSWAAVTLLIVLAYSSLDEIHQVFVPGRGPAVHDVALDTLAGLLAQVLVWWYATHKWPFVPRHTALSK